MRSRGISVQAHLSRLRSDRHGGAAIEFGILAPVLFLIVLGSLDVGRMFYVGQGLQNATQQAARYYTLNKSLATSAITTYLQTTMVGGLGPNVNVAYASTSNCNGNSSVTCTMITATYNFTFVAGYLGLGTKTITAISEAVLY
jgi:Flp pilus assembly protein TadG